MCFEYSKGSFEYPQHMFWLRSKNFILHSLIYRPDECLCIIEFNKGAEETLGFEKHFITFSQQVKQIQQHRSTLF